MIAKKKVIAILMALVAIASVPLVASNAESGVVVLSDSSYTDTSGYFHVVGEVQNNLNANVRFVKISVIFYDEDGEIIGTDYTYTMLDFLRPNQKSPFDLSSYLEQIKPASYDLSVTWKEAPFEGLEIVSHTSSIDSSGYHKIVGIIKNNGEEEAEYVKVVCTYYDLTGTVIGAEYTYARPRDIEVNETSTFTISSCPRKLMPDSYELQVQGS
jgi:hypothetical protein